MSTAALVGVASVTDSGGKVRGAARVLVEGRERVVPFIAGFMTRFWGEVAWHAVEANGRPCLVFVIGGEAVSFLTLEADDEGIHRIDWVMNPEKLARIAGVALGR